MKYQLHRYQDMRGKVPFSQWLSRLKDLQATSQVLLRLNRAAEGCFGDHQYLRNGVWEMRLHIGPGYRIYYSVVQQKIILLLCGGDKASQEGDIRKAVRFWQDYQLGDENE